MKTLGYSASFLAMTPLLGVKLKLKMNTEWYNKDFFQRKHSFRSLSGNLTNEISGAGRLL